MEFSEVYLKRMGANPAQVDRETGELFINPDVWPFLPESFKTWILLHEEGHLKGGEGGNPTANEILADKYAFDHYVGTEKESLRKSVLILHETLPKHSPDQWKRIITMYARALDYDYKRYGNKQALQELESVRKDLKPYDLVPSSPIFPSKKSNLAPMIIAGIMGLVSTLVGAGAKIHSDNVTRNYNQTAAEIGELQSQTAISNQMAGDLLSENNTVAGVSIYGVLIFFALISLAVYLYLKKRR